MNIYRAIREEVFVPIHPAGWPFIAAFAAVTLVVGYHGNWFYAIGVPLTLWCIYFFRNPVRTIPQKEGWIIAPADGRVISIGEAEPEAEMNLPAGKYRRVAIFMNVFDVHVNRAPIAGTVTDIMYRKGKFVNASLDKASTDNERLAMTMEVPGKKDIKIAVVQIAGLVARRILCHAKVGDTLSPGQVFGLIRFGSRVDIWMPLETNVMVLVGQRTVAGETVIADLTNTQQEPSGSIER
ncbi:MAG: phosphatidylserine decarboxylase [Candidatus Puniceispirillaceae bacterium]